MDAIFQKAFTTAMIAALVLLVAYQFFMLWWTKHITGTLPKAIKLLRGINIGILLLTGLFILIWLLRG